MAQTRQDAYIRYLVEREIAHCRDTIEIQDPLPRPDPMSRWAPLIIGTTIALSALATFGSVAVATLT